MTAIYIILLSVGTALICSMLRPQRPEIAAMVSLAIGLGALLLTGQAIEEITLNIKRILSIEAARSEGISMVLKAAGITILGELGVQICMDAGESALAGRIRLACRVVMLGMAMPFIMRIIDSALFVSG